MPTIYRMQIKHDGGVSLPGIDQGKGQIHQVRPNGTLVVKVAGSKYWASRGQQAYAGAEFQVYKTHEVISQDEHSTHLRVERVLDFPVRAQPFPDLRQTLANISVA